MAFTVLEPEVKTPSTGFTVLEPESPSLQNEGGFTVLEPDSPIRLSNGTGIEATALPVPNELLQSIRSSSAVYDRTPTLSNPSIWQRMRMSPVGRGLLGSTSTEAQMQREIGGGDVTLGALDPVLGNPANPLIGMGAKGVSTGAKIINTANRILPPAFLAQGVSQVPEQVERVSQAAHSEDGQELKGSLAELVLNAAFMALLGKGTKDAFSDLGGHQGQRTYAPNEPITVDVDNLKSADPRTRQQRSQPLPPERQLQEPLVDQTQTADVVNGLATTERKALSTIPERRLLAPPSLQQVQEQSGVSTPKEHVSSSSSILINSPEGVVDVPKKQETPLLFRPISLSKEEIGKLPKEELEKGVAHWKQIGDNILSVPEEQRLQVLQEAAPQKQFYSEALKKHTGVHEDAERFEKEQKQRREKETVEFQHELKNVASLIPNYRKMGRLTEVQEKEFTERGDAIYGEVERGGDFTEARGKLQKLREEIVALKEKPTPEKSKQTYRPESLSLIERETGKGAPVGKTGKYNSVQVRNLMRNRLHPSEFEHYEKEGLGEFLKEVRTKEEVEKWLEEKGPKVEVRKFGESTQTEKQKRLAELSHNLDTRLGGQWMHSGATIPEGKPKEWYNEYQILRKEVEKESPSLYNRTHWQSIAPKSEQDMPGYVELAVVRGKNKPYTTESVARDFEPDKFPSSHNFPPNTLGFVRGYMETLPDGKKVFHVIEVQSDWAQAARDKTGPLDSQNRSMRSAGFNDPLLSHYERLALKAAIEHAREQGADAIAISDAETAMMTEGHERTLTDNGPYKTLQEAEFAVKNNDDYDFLHITKNSEGYWITQIDQEPGMRLHYDRTLQKIAGELTGEKGERVSFGEHKMAFENDRSAYNDRGQSIGDPDKIVPRKDLIFRNADGTPKTNVSGFLYPISRASKQFSHFGTDKPEPQIAKPFAPKETPKKEQTKGIGQGIKEAVEKNKQKKSQEGVIVLPSPKQVVGVASKAVEATGLPAAVRTYTEPLIERLERLGGKETKALAPELNKIVSRTKGHYGSITPQLDPAKKAVGFTSPANLWLRGLHKYTGNAAANNLFASNEGVVKVPTKHQGTVDSLNKGNVAIGNLATKASPTFVPSGKLQRLLTVYGLDVIKRGGGKAWNEFAKGTAVANSTTIAKVKQFFRDWKAALDQPGLDTAHLDKISQDFSRQYPKTITHIRPGMQWHEVVTADPFNYLETAAQRTAHAVAFREVFPVGSKKLSDARTKVQSELETGAHGKEFDNVIKALQGHPVDSFTAGWNAPDTKMGTIMRTASQVVGSPLKALMLSGNAIVNLGETLVGGPQIFLGYKNVLPALLRTRAMNDQLEYMGARNKALYNTAFDPSSPLRSVSKILANGIRRVTFQQSMNELQETISAASAKVVADKIRLGTLSEFQKQRIIAVTKSMGFNDADARKMVGGASNELINRFERQAAGWLSGGNLSLAERSRLGASRLFNELFWFHTYPQMTLNQFRSVAGNWAEAVGKGDRKQIYHNSALLGRLIGGRTLQGMLTVAITALAYNWIFGVKEKKQEAKDDIAGFLIDSYIAAMGGPLFFFKKALESGGSSSDLQSTISSAVTPLGIGSELYDMGVGAGRYEGRTVPEKAGMFVQSHTPAIRVIKTGMAIAGLSERDQELDTAIASFRRWRREELGFSRHDSTADTQEQIKFRTSMRRAKEALQSGDKDWRDSIPKDADKDKVFQSLLAARVLQAPDGKDLTDEQMIKLRNRIGDRLVERLEQYDAMVREVAYSYIGKIPPIKLPKVDRPKGL